MTLKMKQKMKKMRMCREEGSYHLIATAEVPNSSYEFLCFCK